MHLVTIPIKKKKGVDLKPESHEHLIDRLLVGLDWRGDEGNCCLSKADFAAVESMTFLYV